MGDENPEETYAHLLKALNKFNLAYVHSVRSDALDAFELVRNNYNGLHMANSDFDFESGNKVIESGLADMVSFGTAYISNPDLVERFKNGQPLQDFDPDTFYTPGPKGYTDY